MGCIRVVFSQLGYQRHQKYTYEDDKQEDVYAGYISQRNRFWKIYFGKYTTLLQNALSKDIIGGGVGGA